MLLMGRLTISTGPFSIATGMFNYQRVVCGFIEDLAVFIGDYGDDSRGF